MINEIELEGARVFRGSKFPICLGPPKSERHVETLDDALSYVRANLDTINELLVKHGAVLFRGFPVESAQDFNEFIKSFGWKDMPYLGGVATRSKVYGVVHTA